MTALENIENNNKTHTFVKVVAWIFIILSGIGLLSSFLQNIVMWTMPVYDELTSSAKDVEGIPFLTKFIMSNLRLYLFVSLVFLIAVFVSSIGLLKLKEWARKLFSVLLAVGIFVGVIIVIGYVSAFSKGEGLFALPSDPEFKPLIIAVMSISFLFSIVLIAAAVWIIVKLNSVKIKSLFETTASNAQG